MQARSTRPPAGSQRRSAARPLPRRSDRRGATCQRRQVAGSWYSQTSASSAARNDQPQQEADTGGDPESLRGIATHHAREFVVIFLGMNGDVLSAALTLTIKAARLIPCASGIFVTLLPYGLGIFRAAAPGRLDKLCALFAGSFIKVRAMLFCAFIGFARFVRGTAGMAAHFVRSVAGLSFQFFGGKFTFGHVIVLSKGCNWFR